MKTVIEDIKDELCLNTFKSKKERHELLHTLNENKNLVYIILIKDLKNGSFIIKIGYSDNLSERLRGIKSNFKTECFILDVFLCLDNKKFEKEIHKQLYSIKYTEPINGHKSTEVFLIENNDHYQNIKQTMNLLVKNYQVRDQTEKQQHIEYQNVNNLTAIIDQKNQLIELYKDEHSLT